MADARRASTVLSTATLRADRGPMLPVRFASVLELGGALFRYVVGSVLPDDGRTVIVPQGGGTGGAWERVREDDRGADLTDADATLLIGDGAWRVLPASTLSANRTKTLGTANAKPGDRITITRLDVGAFTVPVVNGGLGGGVLTTLPVSAKSFAVLQFSGADWALRASALLL